MTETLPPPRTIDNGACTGEVYDQGAQVTRWAPVGAEPVLYVSTDLRLARGRRSGPGCRSAGRGSGRGARRGWSRRTGSRARRTWNLVEVTEGDDETTIVHRLTSDEATSPHWPHRYTAELRARFGRALEVSLTTTNTGDEPFDYEEALHAYLVVGDIHRVRIDGLGGKSFVDKVTGTERVQQGDARPSPARRMPSSARATR